MSKPTPLYEIPLDDGQQHRRLTITITAKNVGDDPLAPVVAAALLPYLARIGADEATSAHESYGWHHKPFGADADAADVEVTINHDSFPKMLADTSEPADVDDNTAFARGDKDVGAVTVMAVGDAIETVFAALPEPDEDGTPLEGDETAVIKCRAHSNAGLVQHVVNYARSVLRRWLLRNQQLQQRIVELQHQPRGPTVLKPFSEWHEDYADVLWYQLDVDNGRLYGEAPHCGTPLDSDWPYLDEAVLFWTTLPDFPALPEKMNES